MQNKLLLLVLSCLLFIFSSCSKDERVDNSEPGLTADGAFESSSGGSSSSSSSSGSSGNGSTEGQEGLITAGEWNDLDNWLYWTTLNQREEYKELKSYWGLFPERRISVLVRDFSGSPMAAVKVRLLDNGLSVFEAMSDNFGKAELFLYPKSSEGSWDLETIKVEVEGYPELVDVQFNEEGLMVFDLAIPEPSNTKVQLNFIVDATGSMGDELEFLKSDLQDVIQRVESGNPSLDFFTSTVFYRDTGDEYLTRASQFTDDITETRNFIEAQSAGGGGDYPEAVHSGLAESLDQLDWDPSAYTKMAFLILDAPPHYDPAVVSSLQNSILEAASKGIKLIPITASGINIETEFLMRFFSILTNGTYVFITDDSGIGNDHLEPTVGDFEVEFLNDLMVRLINKYTE